jgi:hypothetical protein
MSRNLHLKLTLGVAMMSAFLKDEPIPEVQWTMELEPFLGHPELSKTAKAISGCSKVVPAIVYANLLVPGQKLAIHTDVPEFRGASRKSVPQWLLVVMLHSGQFEKWRIPIVTCVSWFGDADGGAFTF